MKKRITTAGYEILDSGTVINFKAEADITIRLSLEENQELSVRMKFEKNPKVDRASFRFDDDEDVTVAIVFVNFEGSMGRGFIKPVKIAEYEGRGIFLRTSIRYMGEDVAAVIMYSIYMEMVGA